MIEVSTKYTWVKPLKDLNAFIEIINDSNHKSNKLWVDHGKEFYNKIIQE